MGKYPKLAPRRVKTILDIGICFLLSLKHAPPKFFETEMDD